MKTLTSLAFLALGGVVVNPSEAGDFLNSATKHTKLIAMGECLASCSDADCLRDCIADVEGPVGPRAAPQQSLENCFGEAVNNITSCAAVILLRGDDARTDVHFAFWTCVNVTSRLFDQCHFDDPGLSVGSQTMLRKIFLGHLIDAAEDDYKLFLAGKLTAYRLNVHVTSGRRDMTSTHEQRAPDDESQPDKFLNCLIDFVNNLVTCENQCGSNGTCLTGCQKVALKVYEKCAGVTPST